MATGEPQRGSDLPAPYRSPWRTLAEALSAVGADLRLALRRLWRRNLQGELPRPGFWPGAIAALFWPLLLIGCIGMAGLLLLLRPGASAPLEVSTAAAPAAPLQPEPLAPSSRSPLMPSSPRAQGESPGGMGAAGPPSVPAMGTPGRQASSSGSADAPTSSSAQAPLASEAPAPLPLQLDPLLALLGEGGDPDLLLAARPDPGRSLLSLTLSSQAQVLPQPSLQQQAERWQQQARDAGYERLELRDAGGRLVGRQALVGSGMILLAPASASR